MVDGFRFESQKDGHGAISKFPSPVKLGGQTSYGLLHEYKIFLFNRSLQLCLPVKCADFSRLDLRTSRLDLRTLAGWIPCGNAHLSLTPDLTRGRQ